MKLETLLFTLLAFTTLSLLLGKLTKSYKAMRSTTLKQSWFWSVITIGSSLFAIVLSFEPFAVPAQWREQSWFLTFVLATVPGIAVLGARKPVVTAWNWFILVPLCFVLFLPAVDRTGLVRQVDLEWPRFFGHAFVLLMGTGNYFGTRHTLKAMLFFFSVCGLGLTFTSAVESISSVDPNSLRAIAVLLLLPLAFPLRTSIPNRNIENTAEEIWREFRDLYGIVWAKRVMDRVNHSSEEEHWQYRLDLGGIVSLQQNDDSMEEESSRKRLREILCWQLKRFYDTVLR